MKKLKKFWQENSVLLVLLLILISCLIAISVVVVTYFVGSSSSKYGDRLEGIENYPFTEDDQNELASKLEEDEIIDKVSIYTSGKRIIITINFVDGTTIVDAQSKAVTSLELIKPELLEFYDVDYNIQANGTDNTDGFKLSGSHNVSGTGGIVWVLNTPIDEGTEEE